MRLCGLATMLWVLDVIFLMFKHIQAVRAAVWFIREYGLQIMSNNFIHLAWEFMVVWRYFYAMIIPRTVMFNFHKFTFGGTSVLDDEYMGFLIQRLSYGFQFEFEFWMRIMNFGFYEILNLNLALNFWGKCCILIFRLWICVKYRKKTWFDSRHIST